jgi:hypothetical protein
MWKAVAIVSSGERAEDAEAGLVEVVQYQKWNPISVADFIGKLARGRHGHALRRHDANIEPLVELHLFEYRSEALLLDVEQGAPRRCCRIIWRRTRKRPPIGMSYLMTGATSRSRTPVT